MATAFSSTGALPPKKTTNTFGIPSVISNLDKLPAKQNPGILSGFQAPKPTTPVKSVTTGADGSNTVVYHAPEKTTTAPLKDYTGTQESMGGNVTPTQTDASSPKPIVSTPQTPPTFPGLLTNLSNTAQSNAQIGQSSQDIAQKAQQEITDIGKKGAGFQAGQLTTGTSPVAEGNAAITAQNIAQQQQAVSQGAQTGLLGNAQALTSRSQEQAGLTSAAGLAQPQFGVSYGTQVANPITGTTTGGGDMTQALDQYASGLANNTLSTKDIPASITGNAILNAQLLDLAKKKNPAYNPTQQGAQAGSIADLTTQASTLQSVANGAESNYNLLLNTATQGGVNQSNVPVINQLTQNLQKGLTSKEAVINFQSTLSTVRSQYASILGGGTVTVDSQNRAQTAIPDDISLGALQSLGVQLKNEATNRINGINTQIKSLQGNQGTNQNATNTNTSNIFSW